MFSNPIRYEVSKLEYNHSTVYYGYTEDLMVLLVQHFLLCSGDWIYAGKTNQNVGNTKNLVRAYNTPMLLYSSASILNVFFVSLFCPKIGRNGEPGFFGQ